MPTSAAPLLQFVEPYLDPEMVAVWTQYEAGEKQGELRGELKRARSTLQRLLTQRFGALSAAHLERLEAASLDELDDMTLRVLTAASVEEVLGMRGSDE